jgi:hypothetical protein
MSQPRCDWKYSLNDDFSFSLMPEGLEAAISIEQMADLIAFLLLPP